MNISEIITIIIASVGLILGVLNTIMLYLKDRIRLKVNPYKLNIEAHNHQEIECFFAVEIVNLSKFPIKIESIYLVFKKNKKHYLLRRLLNVVNNQPYIPVVINSKDSVKLFSPELLIDEEVKEVLVKTSSGHTFKGSAPFLKSLHKDTSIQ